MDNIKEHFADSKNLWQNNYVGEAVEKVESVNGTTTRTCFLCNALVGSFGVKEFVFRVFLRLARLDRQSTMRLTYSVDATSPSVIFVSDDGLSRRAIVAIWLFESLRRAQIVHLANVGWAWASMVNVFPSTATMVIFSPSQNSPPDVAIPPGALIYSYWSTIETLRNVHFQLTEFPEVSRASRLTQETWDWVRFDKVESQITHLEKAFLLVAVVSHVIATIPDPRRHSVVTKSLHLVNFYRTLSTRQEIEHCLVRLTDERVIQIRDDSVVILDRAEVAKNRRGILPFAGVLGLTALAIHNLARDNTFCTYEDFKQSVVRLENILPIRQNLQIVFSEEVDEHDMYYYLVIQKFTQEQILDKQNQDKFSDWWDLTQEGVAGVQLYYTNRSKLAQLEWYAMVVQPFLSSLMSLIAILQNSPDKSHRLPDIKWTNKVSGFDEHFVNNLNFLTEKEFIRMDGELIYILDRNRLSELLDELICYDCQI